MNDLLRTFLAAAAALGGSQNEGARIPIDDANDVLNGADYIPFEVTLARRRGERVVYRCEQKVWVMPDGKEVR
jgi:hypothetical protein